jgi:hypothetical protein
VCGLRPEKKAASNRRWRWVRGGSSRSLPVLACALLSCKGGGAALGPDHHGEGEHHEGDQRDATGREHERPREERQPERGGEYVGPRERVHGGGVPGNAVVAVAIRVRPRTCFPSAPWKRIYVDGLVISR